MTGKIICSHVGVGSKHDFELFKERRLPILKSTQVLADSGYQGLSKLHHNSIIPHKRTKNQPLSRRQKEENHKLSSQRVLVENVIRKLKIFKILAEKYRNRRKRFGLRLNLIAAIINMKT